MFYAVMQFMKPYDNSKVTDSFCIADSSDMSVETASVEKLISSGLISGIDGIKLEEGIGGVTVTPNKRDTSKFDADVIWNNKLIELREAYKAGMLTKEQIDYMNLSESVKNEIIGTIPVKRVPVKGKALHSYYRYDINPFRSLNYQNFGINIVSDSSRNLNSGSINVLQIANALYEISCDYSGLFLQVTAGNKKSVISLSNGAPMSKYAFHTCSFDYLRRYHDYVLVRWHSNVNVKNVSNNAFIFGTLVFDSHCNQLGVSFESSVVEIGGKILDGVKFPFKLYKDRKVLSAREYDITSSSSSREYTVSSGKVFLNTELSHSISQLKY